MVLETPVLKLLLKSVDIYESVGCARELLVKICPKLQNKFNFDIFYVPYYYREILWEDAILTTVYAKLFKALSFQNVTDLLNNYVFQGKASWKQSLFVTYRIYTTHVVHPFRGNM